MPSAFRGHASPLGLLALVSGCAPHADVAGATRSDAVVGGTDAGPGDHAVVFVAIPARSCSGALIAPNLVVTAAHCVSRHRAGDFRCSPEGELELDGSGVGELGGPIEPEEVAVHVGSPRAEEPAARGAAIVSTETLTVCRDDLAFVVLDTHLDDQPTFPIRIGQRVRIGEPMTVIGYGGTGVSTERALLYRREGVPVVDVGIPPRAFALGPGPCEGDSGGPALSATGGITGIYSLLSGDCTSATVRNTYAELAPYADLAQAAFELAGAVPRLDGPAPSGDGAEAATSSESGCALAAPDSAAGPGLAVATLLAGAALRRRRRLRGLLGRLLRGLVAPALAASLSWPLPARADTPREGAADHFDRALAYVDRREFALAIAEFERAYELGKHFSVLYNLGLAYAAVGRYRDARRSLEAYLREGAPNLNEQRRGDVLALSEGYQKQLSKLEIVTLPPTAEVLVDAELHRDTSRVELDPGRHVITARAAGYSESTVLVETTAAEEKTVRIELRAVSTPPQSPPAFVPPPPPQYQALPERTAPGGDQQRTAALVLGGASLAALAVGAGFGLSANALYQDSVDHCPRDQCDLEGFDARERAFDRARIASIAFVVGAGAAVGAGVLWLTAPQASGMRVGVGGLRTGSGFDLRLERRW